jgi:hypothetical protein
MLRAEFERKWLNMHKHCTYEHSDESTKDFRLRNKFMKDLGAQIQSMDCRSIGDVAFVGYVLEELDDIFTALFSHYAPRRKYVGPECIQDANQARYMAYNVQRYNDLFSYFYKQF